MSDLDDADALRRRIAELQAMLAQKEAVPLAQHVDGGVHIGQGDFVAGHKFVVSSDVVHAGTLQARLQPYLQALCRDLATLRLGDIDAEADVQRQQPLDLAEVYVPLDTTLQIPAARGPLAYAVFPWGNQPDPERANYRISGVGTPTVVGCFAPNALGLYDIVGNLWEWTRSLYRFYPYVANDGREDLEAAHTQERVVRGGGYHYSRRDTRCARRSRLPARNRGSGVGFRVVLAAPEAVRKQ